MYFLITHFSSFAMCNIFSIWLKQLWLNIPPLLFSWTPDEEIWWCAHTCIMRFFKINCDMRSYQISGNSRGSFCCKHKKSPADTVDFRIFLLCPSPCCAPEITLVWDSCVCLHKVFYCVICVLLLSLMLSILKLHAQDSIAKLLNV